MPSGWKLEGTTGPKAEVLEHIDKVWTDMRPLSLRQKMEEWEKTAPKVEPLTIEEIEAMRTGEDHFHKAQPPNELCKKLMTEQEIVVIRYRDRDTDEPDADKLKAAIERGYVLVKFPNTKGGTELGANLGEDGPEPGTVDWDAKPGHVTVKGKLKLDYCPLLLTATINLETFKGTGHVEEIPDF